MRIPGNAVFMATLLATVASACGDNPLARDAEVPASTDTEAMADISSHSGHSRRPVVFVMDNCDPTDPGWAPTGGCALPGGTVTVAEFNSMRGSPLSLSVVGHPSWRNQPSYTVMPAGGVVRVRNEGGRAHTFTKVADFGGGFVPPLNQGLTPSPECLSSGVEVIGPRGRSEVEGLSAGDHKFICCIHPWMRAVVKVQ
ncbi:MAG: cupredoxin domain-containing protein [Gemmatimonadota bacterium]